MDFLTGILLIALLVGLGRLFHKPEPPLTEEELERLFYNIP